MYATGSVGLKGFSRRHFPVDTTIWITSSLLRSSYGHWAKLPTSQRDTPNDLHGGRRGWNSAYQLDPHHMHCWYGLHTCMYMNMQIFIHTCIHMNMQIFIHTCIHMNMYTFIICIMYILRTTCTYKHIHYAHLKSTCTLYMHIIHAHIHACIYTPTHALIHINIIHTVVHTYMHMCVPCTSIKHCAREQS